MAQQVDDEKLIPTSDGRYWLVGNEDNSGARYELINSNNTLIGTIIILNKLPADFSPIKLKKNEKYLLLIEVERRYIGKGYGKMMMSAIAEEYKVNTVYLMASHNDHPVWCKVGVIVNESMGYYKVKLKQWVGKCA